VTDRNSQADNVVTVTVASAEYGAYCDDGVQGWHDYKLTWNESEYGGVRSIRVPATSIWTPDVFLDNRQRLWFIFCALYIMFMKIE